MSVARSVVLVGKRYDRIGGWLILVAIGLIISPVRLMVLIGRDLLPSFSSEIWTALTTPGTTIYHPLWAPILIFELVGNIGFIAFVSFVIVYFFRKRRVLPKMIIALLISNLVFILIDYFVVDLIPFVKSQNDTETLRELIQSIIACSIWVPYFLFTKRVKGTFVR